MQDWRTYPFQERCANDIFLRGSHGMQKITVALVLVLIPLGSKDCTLLFNTLFFRQTASVYGIEKNITTGRAKQQYAIDSGRYSSRKTKCTQSHSKDLENILYRATLKCKSPVNKSRCRASFRTMTASYQGIHVSYVEQESYIPSLSFRATYFFYPLSRINPFPFTESCISPSHHKIGVETLVCIYLDSVI